jgi:hypothetical protein
MIVYLASATNTEGDRAMERLYYTKERAEEAAQAMCEELKEKMNWIYYPMIEEMELVE